MDAVRERKPTERWCLDVNLDHLSEHDQEVVWRMIYEQSDVFACEEGDIGCIPGLQLKINTTDNTLIVNKLIVTHCYNICSTIRTNYSAPVPD